MARAFPRGFKLMKNRNRTYDFAAGNATSPRDDLSPFFKKRIFALLGFISLIWLIALLFAVTDIMPLINWWREMHWQADNPAIQHCKPGPWGQMYYSQITVEAPDKYVSPENMAPRRRKWFFKGHSKESLDAFMDKACLTKEQKTLFFQKSKHEPSANGITVYPDNNFILDISPESRAYIYLELARYKENMAYHSPFFFSAEEMNQWEFAPEIQAIIQRLSYNRGVLKALSDQHIVLTALGTHEKRSHYFKTISRATSLFPKLHITRNSNIEAMASYWMKDGNANNLRSLLKSMSQIEGGYDLDILHLLPPIPRSLVYTYLDQSAFGQENPPDCHWSSLNFFNALPDESCLPGNKDRLMLNDTYYRVKGKPAFGDLMLFLTSKMKPVHSCSYIADDIVFTKNGETILTPWIFMKLADVKKVYSNTDFEIVILRRKDI